MLIKSQVTRELGIERVCRGSPLRGSLEIARLSAPPYPRSPPGSPPARWSWPRICIPTFFNSHTYTLRIGYVEAPRPLLYILTPGTAPAPPAAAPGSGPPPRPAGGGAGASRAGEGRAGEGRAERAGREGRRAEPCGQLGRKAGQRREGSGPGWRAAREASAGRSHRPPGASPAAPRWVKKPGEGREARGCSPGRTIAHPPPPRAGGRAGARSPRGAPRSLLSRAGPAPHSRTNNVRLGGTKAAGLGLLNTSEARRAARFIGLGEPRLRLRPRSAHRGEAAGPARGLARRSSGDAHGTRLDVGSLYLLLIFWLMNCSSLALRVHWEYPAQIGSS
ncbi:translation initiation factor IF-2-like [Vidua macroura]|uniref:translation initiation factor IF-2-like n=1 Tax=Vidua macroura TaxID=187451 RepID=UPI0023A875E3|nr:translation initiation factor IF-2-like [Vidua macroura]